MARYTEPVRRVRHLAASCLIVVLAGGSAAAAVCEAVCASPVALGESAGEPIHAHHHPAAARERTADQHQAAVHHQSSDRAAAASTQAEAGRVLGRDCCDRLARPRASLTASRLDTEIVPTSQPGMLVSAPAFESLGPELAVPPHGPPPGQRSPARTPLVLRI